MGLGDYRAVTNSSGSKDILVNGTSVVYSHSFKTGNGTSFGIWARAVSVAGNPSIKVEVEQSKTPPTTEGAAETTLYAIQESALTPVFANINDENAHMDNFPIVPGGWARLKLTGLAGNPADSIFNADIFIQDMVN